MAQKSRKIRRRAGVEEKGGGFFVDSLGNSVKLGKTSGSNPIERRKSVTFRNWSPEKKSSEIE